MTVLKATQAQYEELNGYTNGNSAIQFVEDANGNWIVGKSVLTDPAFIEIKPQLELLEKTFYKPIMEE